MSKTPLPRPTDAELELLSILWRRGLSTLREIHQDVALRRKTGLTTTLKTIQIMTAKGLVIRDASRRPSRYKAATKQRATRGALLRDLIHRAFEGRATRLLMQAVEDGRLSDRQLRDIRSLIDSVRKQKRGDKK